MKRFILVVMIVFMIPFLAGAQEVQELSLRKAIEYAVEHNKQLQVSRKDIDLYRQKVRESVSQGLPQVNGSLDYSTNFGYKMNFGGSAIKMKDQSNVGATLSQLIFSGQWILGIQTSKIAEQIANQQVNITELDIKENIFNTYYAILVSERLRDIIKQNLENMDQIYQHTKNMYDAGTVEITDVDQIRINVGQLKNNLLALDRNVEVNYNLLRLQLGLQAENPVRLTDPLESFLGQEDYVKLAVKQFEINNNPEFQLMQTQEELSKKMVGLQKWTFAPTITGTYSYNYKLLKPDFDMSPKHSAVISMDIPIFSGLQRKAQLEQAKIELEQTSLNKSLLEDQLYVNEKQYKYELKNATENYYLQKENIQVAKRVLENIQRKYEFGAVSSLDLTQANNNYLEAENNYTNACLTLLQAETQLERLYNSLTY
ncbi:transporter [Odoribacter laneus]|jgi:outer membrane efflux protein, putative|uniref:TolC family protein n=1 Tax=Odoribacter laneus TaxID=626933 RepID=UPI00189745F5|nr:TolC family protein [Odoribacter laneus]MBS1445140.1 TolC family protein [Odoribacter sp.]GKI23287.1 transporter [Odoribacter laneus]GKI25387.1 transporter [Odoribacter laneus]